MNIDPDSGSDSPDYDGNKKSKGSGDDGQDEDMLEDDDKKMFNDVWVYDTLTSRWHEIQAPMKIQGPLSGKKLKREFEPRMAHSAV